MKVSLITPTYEREPFLPLMYEALCKQTHSDWEWLIHDTSLHRSKFAQQVDDPRVRYIYQEEPLSIGSKRNLLVELTKSEWIFHIDDDDYYGSHYIENGVKQLQEADFFSINSWFSYDVKSEQYFYWATDHPAETHFVLDALTGTRVREIDFGPHLREKQEAHTQKKGAQGYGFTYAYRKAITKTCRFPDLDIGEDRKFFEQVDQQGYKIVSSADQKGLTVKIIHDANVARVYPQYRLPGFMVKLLIPDFAHYLEGSFHENRLSTR